MVTKNEHQIEQLRALAERGRAAAERHWRYEQGPTDKACNRSDLSLAYWRVRQLNEAATLAEKFIQDALYAPTSRTRDQLKWLCDPHNAAKAWECIRAASYCACNRDLLVHKIIGLNRPPDDPQREAINSSNSFLEAKAEALPTVWKRRRVPEAWVAELLEALARRGLQVQEISLDEAWAVGFGRVQAAIEVYEEIVDKVCRLMEEIEAVLDC